MSNTVYRAAQPAAPDPDVTRQLFEQIGALYLFMEEADAFFAAKTGQQGDEDGRGVQQFADFLDTVSLALRRPDGPAAAALAEALRRYERDRTGGRS